MKRFRKTETLVYTGLWVVTAGLYLIDIMRARAQMAEPLVDMSVLGRMASTLLPFFVLFLVNNCWLIPRYLLRNRLKVYFLLTALAVGLLWVWQYAVFVRMAGSMPHPQPHPHMKPLIPLPLFLDFTYALFVVGANMAVALMFQRFDDKLEQESLMKTNAESQLAYLKAQINPHFYLNMLNNIHGMIEIDPVRAQEMVLDMSALMRHLLYESAKPLIPLAAEVDFLRNYMRLMRLRYPRERVSVSGSFPAQSEMNGISVPPLLFLVFIENAFKHGVSFRAESYVRVAIAVEGGRVRFTCLNSNHSAGERSEGIGLRNVSRRLELIYGAEATLELDKSESEYSVTMIIPSNED